MSFKTDFVFSQSSLQDYIECPRRFQLRYLENLRWPAVEAEPLLERERHMQAGSAFHQMVHQYLSGVPAKVISAGIVDEQLRNWWTHFLATGLDDLPERHYSEVTLITVVQGVRLIAKYDLVAVADDGRVVIVDWKTNTRRPKRTMLEARMQSQVYPYVMTRSGRDLNNGQDIDPAQIEMRYWFASADQGVESFAYSAERHNEIDAVLQAMIREIEASQYFALTEDHRKCMFCTYRSLCQRGEKAGDLMAMLFSGDEDAQESMRGLEFDFDQIAEVEF